MQVRRTVSTAHQPDGLPLYAHDWVSLINQFQQHFASRAQRGVGGQDHRFIA